MFGRLVIVLATLTAMAVLALPGGAALQNVGRTLRPVIPEAGELKGETLYTNSHALIIGVNRYPNLPPDKQLEGAEADAKDLRARLTSRYGFPAANVLLLLSADATRKGIDDALTEFASKRIISKDDRVLIFFSGHGNAVKLGNGSLMGFLIPSDAKVDLKDPDAADYLRSCISMKSVWEKLEACPAKHVLLMADACFSGLLVRGRSPGGMDLALSAAAIREWLGRPGLPVLTAGGRTPEGEGETSKGHGFFTLKLLEELGAKAANPGSAFTAGLLAARLQVSVPNLSPGQLPQFDNYGGTEGQFVLVPTRPIPASSASSAALPGCSR